MYLYRNREFNLSFINYVYIYPLPLKAYPAAWNKLSSFKTVAEIKFYSNYSLKTALEISHRSNHLVLRHMGVTFIYIFYYPHTHKMFSFATWHKQSKIFPVSNWLSGSQSSWLLLYESDSTYVHFEIILSTTPC